MRAAPNLGNMRRTGISSTGRPALLALVVLFTALSHAVALRTMGAVADTPPDPRPGPPATRPATRPAEPADPAARMAKAWADLAHRDPDVRESARVRLMGLPAKDLPALRKLVADSRPLAPAQVAVLREIVTQVFLSGQEYEPGGRDGFLGVRPGEVDLNAAKPRPGVVGGGDGGLFLPGQAIFPDDPDAVYGVVIVERMPGFCGARMLQDGDVVLSIVERPGVQLRGPTEFSQAVRFMGAGQTVHFQVLRQGRVVEVPVTLDARPREADFAIGAPGTPMERLLRERDTASRDYWEQEFAPLLKEGVG